MLDNIAKILQRECKLHQTDRLLVGVSGGPDSVCLLHILHKSRYNLILAHVNHQLRPEADQDVQVVKQFAIALGIQFKSTTIDVRTYSNEHSLSIEEAARTLRYRYLFDLAERMSADAVLVAHTADDQVETILMHLLRGSGMSGLRGMEFRTLPNPWSDHLPLIRPLLTTWRDQILNYLAQNEITPLTDQSNLDMTYFRNRLRYELLPFLDSYNPGVRQNLLRVGQIMRDDYSVLQHVVDEAWAVNLTREAPSYLAFHRQGLLDLPVSIQRYLLRKAIAWFVTGLYDVDFECIERGLKFLKEGKPDGQMDLIAGLCLIPEGDMIWLASGRDALPPADYPAIALGDKFSLNIPSMLSLNDGWQLQAMEAPDLLSVILESQKNQDLYQAWMDGDEITLPLTVRCRAPGDRIQPVGMNGHSIKVSDLMINLKLPKRVRRTWPLVCSGEHILWVPGCRLSLRAMVQADSRTAVHLTLRRDLRP